jgi:hypothetical protein
LFDVAKNAYFCAETDLIRICGFEEQNAGWLARNRENSKYGKLGGRPKSRQMAQITRNNPRGLFSGNPRGLENHNPYDLDLDLDQKSISLRKANRKESENLVVVGISPGAIAPSEPPPIFRKFSGLVLPADWQPSQENQNLAAKLHLDLATQAKKFSANARSKGRTVEDWQLEFALWLENSANFIAQKKSKTATVTSAKRAPKRLA